MDEVILGYTKKYSNISLNQLKRVIYHNLNEQSFKKSKKYIPKIPTDILRRFVNI